MILLIDTKVKSDSQIVQYLEYASSKNQPLLIVCNDMDSDVLTTLVINKHSKNLQVCVVNAPAFENQQVNKLTDIAVVTGG